MRYDISSADEATRRAGVQYLKDIVRKIAVQGGELFSGVTFAGWGVPKEFVDEAKKRALFDRSVASMREVMTVAEGEGVTICVEAVNRFESPLINTAQEAVAYVQTVDSPNVGVHLDTYHMNIEEDSIEDAIRYAAKYLRHFHTGENNRNVPGRGHLDWEGIFRTLAEIGYRGDIVSEPFLMMGDEVGYDIRVWRPILDNPTEARLDSEAAFLLEFTRTMLRRYER